MDKEKENFIHGVFIDRRSFLKMTAAAAAALGLGSLSWPDSAEAAGKPAVLWLHGQECTGCTESVLSALDPDPRDVILDVVSIRYHETIMAASGYVAEEALEATILEGNYVLVMEGSIPNADDRYLYVAGKPLRITFLEAAQNAAAIIAIGACATYGGINGATVTRGLGVSDLVSGKPIVNLPGCPLKPTWFYGTLLYYLNNGTLPPLDSDLRPLAYFSRKVHQDCPRRFNFMQKNFLTDWNDPAQEGYCLFLKGCKGRWTRSDCSLTLWNEGANTCIKSNAPCAGCTEAVFYDGFSPLYTNGVIKGGMIP